jgi:hypothetical protein
MAELVEATRERMERVDDAPIGGFEARVIRNVLAIVERELELGPGVEQQRAETMARHGAVDEEDLAAAIRSGVHDDRIDELRGELLALAERQLDIDNPRW